MKTKKGRILDALFVLFLACLVLLGAGCRKPRSGGADLEEAQSYCLVASWGSHGTGDGELNGPTGLAVDRLGNVYVLDAGNYRVQKFHSSERFLAKWGSEGSANGQFGKGEIGPVGPKGIAVDRYANVYVGDTGNHRVQKFDSSGEFLLKWGSIGTGDGQFLQPEAVAVDSSGGVYAADTFNHRIQKFDSSGNFILKWGSLGSRDGEFSYPAGIATETSGNVYVVDHDLDTSGYKVQKFDGSGRFLGKWEALRPPLEYGLIGLPPSVGVDPSGGIYVTGFLIGTPSNPTSTYYFRKFDSMGKRLLLEWSSAGPEGEEFRYPTGVAFDSSGNLYVADQLKDSIQKFQPHH